MFCYLTMFNLKGNKIIEFAVEQYSNAKAR